jgi:hypothetical protein
MLLQGKRRNLREGLPLLLSIIGGQRLERPKKVQVLGLAGQREKSFTQGRTAVLYQQLGGGVQQLTSNVVKVSASASDQETAQFFRIFGQAQKQHHTPAHKCIWQRTFLIGGNYH